MTLNDLEGFQLLETFLNPISLSVWLKWLSVNMQTN